MVGSFEGYGPKSIGVCSEVESKHEGNVAEREFSEKVLTAQTESLLTPTSYNNVYMKGEVGSYSTGTWLSQKSPWKHLWLSRHATADFLQTATEVAFSVLEEIAQKPRKQAVQHLMKSSFPKSQKQFSLVIGKEEKAKRTHFLCCAEDRRVQMSATMTTTTTVTAPTDTTMITSRLLFF